MGGAAINYPLDVFSRRELTGAAMIVKEYLSRLRANRKGKPGNIKEALDIYIGLWDDMLENGTVSEQDEVDVALSKIDKAGGLYGAAAVNP